MERAPADIEETFGGLRREIERALARACPAWLASERDDLVQKCMIRLLEMSRRSEGGAEFSAAYLRKAAWNQLIDEIRRRGRRPEARLDDRPESGQVASPSPTPERLAGSSELGVAIRSCLAKLVRPRRLAVTLALLGHSYREISRLLGWQPKRVENLVLRGRADLKACLEREGYGT